MAASRGILDEHTTGLNALHSPMIPFHRSLRFRIAITFVLLSVSLNTVLTLALRISREQSLLAALDSRLGRMSEGLSKIVEHEGIISLSPERIAEGSMGGLSLDGWFVQVRDAREQLVVSNSTAGPIKIPETVWGEFSNQASLTTPTQLEAKTIVLPPGLLSVQKAGVNERARAGLMSVRDGSGQIYHMLFGSSMAMADNLTAALGRTLILTGCGATLAAGLAGWVVASLLAIRVGRITDAMRSVTPKALSAGMKVPEGPDEFGQIGATLNTMLAGLERAFRSQERFISDVSHELKTPLAAMLTEAQVLHGGEPTEKDFRAFVTSTEDEARRLGKLVESFLMLTRFEHGKRFVADEMVSVNDVALDAMQHSQIFAKQKNVAVRVTIYDPEDESQEGLVRGDFELLRVAVDNMIRNAVQISKPGDLVQVSVGCVEGQMSISVRDFGPGVHPDYLDRAFDRFYQAPTRESGARGTGLGLAIAKGIVDLHRGTIQAENHAEGGCVFTITLPPASDAKWKDLAGVQRA
ncbi:MAG: HAMP domain-containing protein [Pyrinomonadaceae bacterium]|nr:HAMP domain-containing protein [Phycisphaerales bacterium]